MLLFSCDVVCPCSEGQSAAIPVASMEFAAICLRNALLLLPEHQQQEAKTENGSKNSSQSGSTESGSENSDACRSEKRTCCLVIHLLTCPFSHTLSRCIVYGPTRDAYYVLR